MSLDTFAAFYLAAALVDTFPKGQIVSWQADRIGFSVAFTFHGKGDEHLLRLLEDKLVHLMREPLVFTAMLRSNLAEYLDHIGQKVRARSLRAERGEVVTVAAVSAFKDEWPLSEELPGKMRIDLLEIEGEKEITIRGVAALSPKELKEKRRFFHLAKERHWKSLGSEMGLWTEDGLTYLPAGCALARRLIACWLKKSQESGFQEIASEMALRKSRVPLLESVGNYRILELVQEEDKPFAIKDLWMEIVSLDRLEEAIRSSLQSIDRCATLLGLKHRLVECQQGEGSRHTLSSLATEAIERALEWGGLDTPLPSRDVQALRLRMVYLDALAREWPLPFIEVSGLDRERVVVTHSRWGELDSFIQLMVEHLGTADFAKLEQLAASFT